MRRSWTFGLVLAMAVAWAVPAWAVELAEPAMVIRHEDGRVIDELLERLEKVSVNDEGVTVAYKPASGGPARKIDIAVGENAYKLADRVTGVSAGSTATQYALLVVLGTLLIRLVARNLFKPDPTRVQDPDHDRWKVAGK
jgi:hypothetical protein